MHFAELGLRITKISIKTVEMQIWSPYVGRSEKVNLTKKFGLKLVKLLKPIIFIKCMYLTFKSIYVSIKVTPLIKCQKIWCIWVKIYIVRNIFLRRNKRFFILWKNKALLKKLILLKKALFIKSINFVLLLMLSALTRNLPFCDIFIFRWDWVFLTRRS